MNKYNLFCEKTCSKENLAVNLHPQSETIELWCNGNTTDSGPVFPGSSPGSSTEKVERNVRPFSFFSGQPPTRNNRPTNRNRIFSSASATPSASYTSCHPRSPSATICSTTLQHPGTTTLQHPDFTTQLPSATFLLHSRLHHSTPPPATFLLHPLLHYSTPPPVQPLRDMSLNQHIMPTSGQMLLRSLRDVVAAPFNGYIRSRKECPRLIQQHRLILVTRREVPDQQPSDTGHCSDLGGLLRRRMAS